MMTELISKWTPRALDESSEIGEGDLLTADDAISGLYDRFADEQDRVPTAAEAIGIVERATVANFITQHTATLNIVAMEANC